MSMILFSKLKFFSSYTKQTGQTNQNVTICVISVQK